MGGHAMSTCRPQMRYHTFHTSHTLPFPHLAPARALYCLEMGWHAAFDVSTANVRMDFELEENRAMFTALFRHTQ
eukprot:187138-Chlamydomonas_euryale.AAC.1